MQQGRGCNAAGTPPSPQPSCWKSGWDVHSRNRFCRAPVTSLDLTYETSYCICSQHTGSPSSCRFVTRAEMCLVPPHVPVARLSGSPRPAPTRPH